jgi:hypothetical protein
MRAMRRGKSGLASAKSHDGPASRLRSLLAGTKNPSPALNRRPSVQALSVSAEIAQKKSVDISIEFPREPSAACRDRGCIGSSQYQRVI